MKLIGTFILLILAFTSLGQPLSRQGLSQDLAFLQEAVQHGHPVNYQHKNTVSLTQLRDSVDALNEDSLSPATYRLIIGSALQQIGCVHTTVVKNPTLLNHPDFYFPFATCLLQQKLYVSQQSPANPVYEGQEIIAINGVPVRTIVDALLHYAASDGGGQALAHRYLNRASSSLLAFYFNYPQHYQLQFPTRQVVVEATQAPAAVHKPTARGAILISNKGNQLIQLGPGIGLLRLQSFSRSDVDFINQVFVTINKAGLTNLLLDLRGNTGGHRGASVALAKYIVPHSFSYSILKPRLKPGPYLNSTGRFYFLLSKLKYQLGHLLKRHRTELGIEFRYRYQPEKEVYRGQLYVLTDGFTASAATMVTSWVKQYTTAMFIGSQAGGGYNGNNGGSFPLLTLPYSKMQLRFPVYRLILDETSNQRHGLVPDHLVDYTIEDVLANQDKEIEFILPRIAGLSN